MSAATSDPAGGARADTTPRRPGPAAPDARSEDERDAERAGLDPPDSVRRNIVLTGFMGTGKSTVGRLLADRLGLDFVDTDSIIEERHGPIALIFAEQGEAAFRSIERVVARDLGSRRGLVVATGGRLMVDPDNAAALRDEADVFCLVAEPDDILDRVRGPDGRIDRPLLAVPDPAARVRELLAERADAYARFPAIDTANRTADDVATEIIRRLAD